MNSIRKILDKILEVACILIFGIMTILVVYQVVTRYVFQSPSSWSESVVTYGFIWLAMLGGAYVFGKRDHMAMTFVLDKFHGRVKTIIEMINELIIVLFWNRSPSDRRICRSYETDDTGRFYSSYYNGSYLYCDSNRRGGNDFIFFMQ